MSFKHFLSPFYLLIAISLFSACSEANVVYLYSPDQDLRFELRIDADTQLPVYSCTFKGQPIIQPSALGLELAGGRTAPGRVHIESVSESTVDTTWKPVYGEKSQYPDHYHQALIRFATEDSRPADFHLEVRVYNEGIAFRYVAEQEGETVIQRELTEFSLPEAAQVWVSAKAQGPIEKVQIGAIQESVERPLLAQISDTLFVAIGEAALVDFARMKFALHETKSATLRADLASEVRMTGAFHSPWRFIMVGNTPGEILENNYLLLNLNPPHQFPTTDWIQPGKVIREVTLTTQGGMACVDFAVQHNLQYVEFDAGWYGNEYDEASDATTITVDPKRSKGPLELRKVIDYAAEKGIGVLLYVNRRALEKQIDEVLPLLQSWGVKGVKYGFVNVGSQEWTRWLHEAVQKAADHELMIDIHDEYRPTGVSRTYPNLMTQEGIRGDEESPDNTMVLKTLFTRMIAGAGDHTNCYFAPRVQEKMGSHASQLAKAVCIYSPWQFLYWYDRPQGSPAKAGGAGNNELFIREVPELSFYDQLPTVWEDTRILSGYPGAYAVVVRRSGSTWFVGALNGNEGREFQVPLSFLQPDREYQATLYTDDPASRTPTHVSMTTRSVSATDSISHLLKKHQGMAMIIREQ